jgi:putative FmdB family regulatory protein
MPIYEYDCPSCGRIEVMQRITAEPLTECPYCLEASRHSPVQRMMSLTSFQLKGTGWYKTDNASNGSSHAAAKKSAASEATSSDKPTIEPLGDKKTPPETKDKKSEKTPTATSAAA